MTRPKIQNRVLSIKDQTQRVTRAQSRVAEKVFIESLPNQPIYNELSRPLKKSKWWGFHFALQSIYKECFDIAQPMRRKNFSRSRDIKEFVSTNIDRFLEKKHIVGGFKDKSRSSKIKFIMEPEDHNSTDERLSQGMWPVKEFRSMYLGEWLVLFKRSDDIQSRQWTSRTTHLSRRFARSS